MSGSAPLAGIRVADFGHFIAAPLCAALLADMGADVVRVERPGGSEDREVTSLFQHEDGTPGEGASFLQYNRNKRGLTVDFTSPEGAEIIRRLICWADIVVANFPLAVLKKLKLDFDSIHEVNPRAILVATSGFGNEGPYADRVCFDGIAQVMSGGTWLSGTAEQPQRAQVTWVDNATGILGAFGALAALRARDQTGLGQAVNTSLLSTALMVNSNFVIEQAVIRPDRVPHGNRAHAAGPADLFRCTDGWIFIGVQTNSIFRRWARVVGAEDMIDDPRFVDDVTRGRNGAALSDHMQAWCDNRSVAEAIAALEAGRVPAGPVYNLDQVLADPHVVATEAFELITFPGIDRPAPIAKAPLTLSDFARGPIRRAPLAGENNDDVLAELGFDTAAIADLHARAVV
ncbi:MAG: formyl-CoA transferase [Bradyrhizobium sp.]|nr:formyl-CoA transferase [Bradyrhizobium sp.]